MQAEKRTVIEMTNKQHASTSNMQSVVKILTTAQRLAARITTAHRVSMLTREAIVLVSGANKLNRRHMHNNVAS